MQIMLPMPMAMLRVMSSLMLQVSLNVGNSLLKPWNPANLKLVKHVHWLRSRALKDQWHEELILVTHEMQWTVRYFLHKATYWKIAVHSQSMSSGAKLYAHRQQVSWMKLAHNANQLFQQMPSQYLSPLL